MSATHSAIAAAGTRPAYGLRAADWPVDAGHITALWSANLAGLEGAAAEQKLQLGYLANPAGVGMATLLSAGSEAEPVGVIGLHPRTGAWGPHRVSMANLSDFAVQPKHRSLGPALQLVKAAVAQSQAGCQLVYGMPNRSSAAVMARAGLACIGRLQRHAKVLKMSAFLRNRMPAPLAVVLAPAAELVVTLADALRHLISTGALAARPADWHSPIIDELWERRPPELLLNERSGAMMRWRFTGSGRSAWSLATMHDRTGQAQGHFVWRLSQGAAEVADFYSVEPRALTLPLLLAMCAFLRRQGAASASVSLYAPPWLAAAMGDAGFTVRDDERKLYLAVNQIAMDDLPERWIVTVFDDDAD